MIRLVERPVDPVDPHHSLRRRDFDRPSADPQFFSGRFPNPPKPNSQTNQYQIPAAHNLSMPQLETRGQMAGSLHRQKILQELLPLAG